MNARNSDRSRIIFNDVLLKTHGGDSEETLLTHSFLLSCEVAAVSGGAEGVDVDGENIGDEVDVGGVGVGSGQGEGVDVVESTIDEDGGAGGVDVLGQVEGSHTINGVSSIGELIVVSVEIDSSLDWNSLVEGGDRSVDVAATVLHIGRSHRICCSSRKRNRSSKRRIESRKDERNLDVF